MKKYRFNLTVQILRFILSLFLFSGCQQMSEQIKDASVGMNGSFEITKNDLPVNWLMYTPNTVKKGDFNIILDNKDFKEGKQSLKFEVRECSSVGGWWSPGFTNQFNAIPGGQYKLSFWIKNDKSEFVVSAGGVSPKTGDMKTLIKSNEQIDNWKFLDFIIDIPKEHESLRLEVNILKSGTFWIDDIKIKELKM